MNDINARLVQLRAKALLTISLTARNDLAVEEVTADSGYDFIVRISKNGSLTNRMFAAELKATAKDVDLPRVQLSVRQLLIYKDIPFPVCLFFFLMSNDKGYYKWLVEPTISAGIPGLTFCADEHKLKAAGQQTVTFPAQEFVELNPGSLERLVGSVNGWYETRASLK